MKGYIDADFDLVFNKTLSQKYESMGWGTGPAKGGQNLQNMPSLWHHLQKTSTENEKHFLSMSTRRLAESVEGFKQLSSSSGWRVMAKKGLANRGR